MAPISHDLNFFVPHFSKELKFQIISFKVLKCSFLNLDYFLMVISEGFSKCEYLDSLNHELRNNLFWRFFSSIML